MCGNGVVEPPEDCDSFARSAGSACRPAGTPGACHLDCRRRSDGTRPTCPAGWGCDADDLCRAPTGAFQAPVELPVGGAFSLMAGDFDGDGRADVLSRAPLNALGQSKLRFHYFDTAGALAETVTFPKLSGSPVITALTGSGRADLVFADPDLGIGALLGRPDRSWVPETFGSYRAAGASGVVVSVLEDLVQQTTPVMALLTLDGTPRLYGPDFMTGMLLPRAVLPGPLDRFAGDPVTANVVDDPGSPCREVVLAVRGDTAVSMFDTCRRGSPAGPIEWRDQAVLSMIALEPPTPIDAAPQVTDIDGDGHLDVLVGAGGRAFVAYGDGHTLAAARPFQVALAGAGGMLPQTQDLGMPLAAGDFTGDGVVDFVFEDRLLISHATPGSPPTYAPDHPNFGAPWTEARIIDLNANGKPDVVAASSRAPDITFFNGTGSEHLPVFTIATPGPVRQLAVNDLDGDLDQDLAFLTSPSDDDRRDLVMVAFGSSGGRPLAPVPFGRVTQARQLIPFGRDGLGGLVVASTEAVGDHSEDVFTFISGSGDRIPSAAYQPSSFTSDGSIMNPAVLAVTAGGFTAPGRGELAFVGSDNLQGWHVWLVTGFGTAGIGAQRLDAALDPRLEPSKGMTLYGLAIQVVGASADLDRDGRDDAVWAMPADDGRRCALLIIGMTGDDPVKVARTSTVFLDEPCPAPQLVIASVDGDGQADLAVLTGAAGAPGRKLMVLWNDGQGGFSSGSSTVVNPTQDSPQAFAVLAPSGERPLSFVYVTDQAAVQVPEQAARFFAAPHALAPLSHGTGVVVADVNGDGVADLVLADHGNLTVMKAELTAP